jgi:hypothetical protein
MHSILNGILMGEVALLLKHAYKSCARCGFRKQTPNLDGLVVGALYNRKAAPQIFLELFRATIYSQLFRFRGRRNNRHG